MIVRRQTVPVILALLITSILFIQDPAVQDINISADPARAENITFTNVSKEVGLSGIRGNFFSWGDYDNDGDQDLLIDGKRLMANTGAPNYRFLDQTAQSGISSSSNSGVFGDYDNDGYLDIFCGGGKASNDHPEYPDVLWHNERDGTFRKVEGKGNVPGDTFPTVAAGWSDTNRDGYIDLYMVNYEDGSYEGYPDHFWINNGDGTFTNSTSASGMSEYDNPYQGRGVSFCDFDNDGFQDAYVSNYRIMPNYLYRNDREGKFNEMAEEYGIEGHGNLHPVTREGPYYGHSLGSSWGDLDNDGDMDLWVTNLAHKDVYRGPICDDSYLFENLGEMEDYRFEDVRDSSGIETKPLGGSVTEGDELMVSSSLADYDNDGDLDLFIPQIYADLEYAYSFLYENQGDMTFIEKGQDVGIRVWNTYGSAWCDYNNDGWMDLVTGGGVWSEGDSSTQGYMVHLYRNNGAVDSPASSWLKVDLHGRESNAASIGSRVKVSYDTDGDGSNDVTLMRDVQGGTAAHGQQDSMVLHFGLGKDVHKVDVTVEWPMGRDTVIEDVEPGRTLDIYEPTDPIFLIMNITSVSENGDDAEPEFLIENPSDHDIDTGWIDIEYVYGNEIMERSLEFGDVPSGEIILMRTSSSEYPFEGLIEVRARIDRTYPPVAEPLQDRYVLSVAIDEPPVPVLEVKDAAEVGEEVIISGEGSYDPNGTVEQYSFDFGDGTGTGWTYSSVVTHSYSRPGNFTISLEVMDAEGTTSMGSAMSSIIIEETEIPPPEAIIVTIDPEISEEGDEVSFIGEGIPYRSLSIKEYEWSSSIDGILSRRSSFTEDDLSIGIHKIEFKVKDSEGLWSEPDSMEIEVIGDIIEPTWVSIDQVDLTLPLTGPLLLKGVSGPEGEVDRVEVRVDSQPWREARGTSRWEFLIEVEGLDPDRTHVVQVRAMANGQYSEIEDMEFNVEAEHEGPLEEFGEPGGTESRMNDWPVLIFTVILGILIMIIIIFIFIIPRKKRPLAKDMVMALEVE